MRPEIRSRVAWIAAALLALSLVAIYVSTRSDPSTPTAPAPAGSTPVDHAPEEPATK